MNSGSIGHIKPLPNIFDYRQGNDHKYMPVALILISVISFAYIFGLNFNLFMVIIIFVALLPVLISFYMFKGRNSGSEKINLPGNMLIMEMQVNFSWNSNMDKVKEKISSMNSISEYLGNRFAMFSLAQENDQKIENCGPITDSLQKTFELGNKTIKNRSYLAIENISNERNYLNHLAENLKKHGIEVINLSEQEKGRILEELHLVPQPSHWHKRYSTGKRKFSTQNVVQIRGGSFFQISQFISASNMEINSFVRFRKVSKEHPHFKRTLSSILARDRIMREKKKPVGAKLKDKVDSAMFLREDADKYYYNVEVVLTISSDKTYKLAQMIDSLHNYARLWGVEIAIPAQKYIIGKLFDWNKQLAEYPQAVSKLVSFFPILFESQRDGIILGNDDLTGNPVAFNPYSMSSHNVLIMGETGSCKSFFSKLLLTRMIIQGYAKRILVMDVLDEYDENNWKYEILKESREKNDTSLEIMKCMDGDYMEYLAFADSFMKKSENIPTVILMEEGHTFFRDAESFRKIVEMVKVSRHYETSIIIVSQDSSDFTSEDGKKILNNSLNIFIFRNKLMSNLQKFGINPSDYGLKSTHLSLAGGKDSPFSETLLFSLDKMTKIKVSASEWEIKNFS